MNTKNNKRRQASRQKLEKAFIELLQTREIDEISVSELCKLTKLNRSTFYANYEDIYDLADKIRDGLESDVAELYDEGLASKLHSSDWLKLLYHIKENQLFYNTYFKLGYDKQPSVDIEQIAEIYRQFPEKHLEYHIEFFKAGFNAIVKRWLGSGCKESPEEISGIIKDEYGHRDVV